MAVAILLLNGKIHFTALLFPLIFGPLVLLALGSSWFMASLSVYMRDIGQLMLLFTSLLMFLAPVSFPLSAVPPVVRKWIMANPLRLVIEQSHQVLIWGGRPDWLSLSIYRVIASVVAWLWFAWFQKTRKGFANVL